MNNVIGDGCDVLVNSVPYIVQQGTYQEEKKRLIRTRVTKGLVMQFIDYGPIFKTFKLTIVLGQNYLSLNQVTDTRDPHTLRDNLWTLYNTQNTSFGLQTPLNEYYTVIFIDLKEKIPNFSTYYNPGGSNLYPTDYEMDCEFLEI